MAVSDVYVGAFTSDFSWLKGVPAQGITRFNFDHDDGTLSYVETVTGVSNPQYLEVHPHLPVLFAAEYSAPGNVTAFSIRPGGGIDRLTTRDALGDLPVAVSVHPSGARAYVANWGTGTLAAFPLTAEGTMSAPEPIGQQGIPGQGPGDLTNNSAHPHQICPNPDGSAVLVAYAGGDELTTYKADADGALSALPISRIAFPAKGAPRHMQFHPSGKFVYVVGESTDALVYLLEADEGVPTRIAGSYPTNPDGFIGTSLPSELQLHPNGRILYVANRMSSFISVFELDETGVVTRIIGHQSSMGQGPRSICVDPNGQYLIAANCDSGDVVVFQISESGLLDPISSPVPTNSPSSVLFVR
jgi:6-phosphogluconolactonase